MPIAATAHVVTSLTVARLTAPRREANSPSAAVSSRRYGTVTHVGLDPAASICRVQPSSDGQQQRRHRAAMNNCLKPARNFLLKKQYMKGLTQLLAEPAHCVTGIITCTANKLPLPTYGTVQ